MFTGLLAGIFYTSNHTKYISLNNKQCTTQPTLVNLHPNEYSQGLSYYPFAVDLDKCLGSCNTFINLSNRVCGPKKTKDLNLKVLDMITRINKLKTLTKHISCECEYKCDSKKCSSNQKWNNDKYWCERWNPEEDDVCKKKVYLESC